MAIGVLVADESVSLLMMMGAGLILVALAIHQNFWRAPKIVSP
jgi:hypothetical protein